MSVLIISEEHDTITDSVVSWLNYFSVPYLRINNPAFQLEHVIIKNNNIDIAIRDNETIYDLNQFRLIWCRRGFLNMEMKPLTITALIQDQFIRNQIVNHLYGEIRNLESIAS